MYKLLMDRQYARANVIKPVSLSCCLSVQPYALLTIIYRVPPASTAIDVVSQSLATDQIGKSESKVAIVYNVNERVNAAVQVDEDDGEVIQVTGEI